jgi:CRISPR-associated endonuclease/helicase Cas3
MSGPNFSDVFRDATGGAAPYAYQCRLACGLNANPENCDSFGGADCRSLLINVPTGLGKTAAVVLAWVCNRIIHRSESHRESWPRRSVYCLPMRTLVEQTKREILRWLANLSDKADELGFATEAKQQLAWLRQRSPIILMGGEELNAARRDWDLCPEKLAILIGTQDMVLSRALNRGYGMSRYRRPMHFRLLNNGSCG